ncbi:MAG: TetR/AcrR family transcriptional regulator [Burkholderiales bacterium]
MLAAAAGIIEKEGLAGLSVREAARRAGVSHNAPYRHFPDRDALLAALAADSFELLTGAIENRGAGGMGEAYVRFALEHPGRFRLMFGGQLPLERCPKLRAKAQAALEKLQEVFAELGTEASFAAAAAWSLVHGLANLILDGHLGNRDDFVKRVLGAIRFTVGGKRS